ncbi:mobile mystery protein A [Pollutibacter soli]|uniref:mobile mystery protein A n=1 Tax=Pollutibacter soli TaxID=3034157 RepID=UPI0030139DED
MKKKHLQVQQLDNKFRLLGGLTKITVPPSGWLKAIREALGISLDQLGRKLSITKQSVTEIEERERNGTITLKSLREAADALDMQLFYALIPKDGSLNDLIERKAKELAKQIVMRTSNTMKLEDQENSQQRIEKAIEERTTAIKNEMPRTLWD